MARFTLSKILPLAHFRTSTTPTLGARCCLRSTPSSTSPQEHIVASTTSPSTSLDLFTHDLHLFTWSTLPPPALEHAIDLDRFTQSTSLTSTASSTPLTVRFTNAPDRALCSTSSFPYPQVIHEELANCCRILSSSTKIELPGHSSS
jgi:hypothetical protein